MKIPRIKVQRIPHDIFTRSDFGLFMFLFVLCFSFAFFEDVQTYQSRALANLSTLDLVSLTNLERAKYNLKPLLVNERLELASELKAKDMSNFGYFDHVSPAGVTPWYWFRQADYVYSHAGENLAVSFSTSQGLFNAWINSPTHRKNILSPHFNEIGISSVPGERKGKKTVYVVQHFGKSLEDFKSENISLTDASETILVDDRSQYLAALGALGVGFDVTLLSAFDILIALAFLLVLVLVSVSRARAPAGRKKVGYWRVLLLGALIIMFYVYEHIYFLGQSVIN